MWAITRRVSWALPISPRRHASSLLCPRRPCIELHQRYREEKEKEREREKRERESKKERPRERGQKREERYLNLAVQVDPDSVLYRGIEYFEIRLIKNTVSFNKAQCIAVAEAFQEQDISFLGWLDRSVTSMAYHSDDGTLRGYEVLLYSCGLPGLAGARAQHRRTINTLLTMWWVAGLTGPGRGCSSQRTETFCRGLYPSMN